MVTEGVVALAEAPAVAKVFESVAIRLAKAFSGPARATAIKVLASLQGYSAYLTETNDRVSTVKTFANPALPVSLMDHFVTTELKTETKGPTKTQDYLVERLKSPSRLVVSATAGYGKSMLMRYLALCLYENPQGRIPIFIELRDLNRVSAPSIITYINTVYKTVHPISIEAFKRGLEIGAFALILDGFDEVNHDLRSTIEAQILDLSRLYPKVSIIVSGRPDDKFLSWRAFEVYKICPMSKTRVIELIEKLEYDRGTKKRFIGKIKKGLFESHKSFLSTPLLAILMLLTYEENANIPDKMHLFYAKAFETLFHKHDAMKEQYERQRKSGLQIDEFEKVFSVFCLNTYVLEKLEFTRTELIRFIKGALQYEQKDADPSNLLFDLEESVCLLQKEGTSFFFVHRSFQEYFTAVFLSNCPEEVRDEFIDRVAQRYWDNVLPMLFDMASGQLEPSWVVTKTDEYLDDVQKGGDETLNALKARWKGIGFYNPGRPDEFTHLISGKFNGYLAVMHRFYPTKLEFSVDKITVPKFEYFIEPGGKRRLPKPRTKNVQLPTRSVAVSEFMFSESHREILERSGLMEFASRELDGIRRVRAGVDKQQNTRNEFLQKLFKSRPR